MLPFNCPDVIVAKLINAGLMFSLGKCPGEKPLVDSSGAFELPMFALSTAPDITNGVLPGSPDENKIRPGPALSALAVIDAANWLFGTPAGLVSLGSELYHQSKSDVPEYAVGLPELSTGAPLITPTLNEA